MCCDVISFSWKWTTLDFLDEAKRGCFPPARVDVVHPPHTELHLSSHTHTRLCYRRFVAVAAEDIHTVSERPMMLCQLFHGDFPSIATMMLTFLISLKCLTIILTQMECCYFGIISPPDFNIMNLIRSVDFRSSKEQQFIFWSRVSCHDQKLCIERKKRGLQVLMGVTFRGGFGILKFGTDSFQFQDSLSAGGVIPLSHCWTTSVRLMMLQHHLLDVLLDVWRCDRSRSESEQVKRVDLLFLCCTFNRLHLNVKVVFLLNVYIGDDHPSMNQNILSDIKTELHRVLRD